jgi:hypothetical protein
LVKTIVKTFDCVFAQEFHESSKSDTLAIDDGYRAKYASFVKDAWITEADPNGGSSSEAPGTMRSPRTSTATWQVKSTPWGSHTMHTNINVMSAGAEHDANIDSNRPPPQLTNRTKAENVQTSFALRNMRILCNEQVAFRFPPTRSSY